MADAVLWQILESVRDGLRNDLSFLVQGSDNTRPIKDASIIIHKSSPRDRDTRKNNRRHTVPGIVITPPSNTVRNPYEGTNERDDVRYTILIQIIDGDSGSSIDNLRTYLKWQEQIGKYLNSQGLTDVMSSDGWVTLGWVKTVDNIDEKDWVTDDRFVSGILVEFISREPRGVT